MPEFPTIDPEQELEAGARWLRDLVEAARAARVVVGLSGGIDSAVTLLWGVRAVGADRVTAIAMPYGLLAPFHFAPSAVVSLEHARLVAAQVPGVDYREIDIAPTVDAEADASGLASELHAAPDDELLRLALANLKARIRAVRLRYFANRLGGLVLGTENRTEHYLGYFTTGGDEESDLEILGNYLKTEVVQLAKALGVPQAIIDKAPSADLWTGQTDEDELGFSYGEADHVLHLTNCSAELTPDAAARCSVERGTAERVLKRVRATEFKRAVKPVFPRTAA